MAIGSAPEIGAKFSSGVMTDEERVTWYEHIRTVWGPDLLGGYGTLVYKRRRLDGTYPDEDPIFWGDYPSDWDPADY